MPESESWQKSIEAATAAIQPFLEAHVAGEQRVRDEQVEAAAIEAGRPLQLALL